MTTENIVISKEDGWVQIPLGKVSICQYDSPHVEIAFTDSTTAPADALKGEPLLQGIPKIIPDTQLAWVRTSGDASLIIVS